MVLARLLLILGSLSIAVATGCSGGGSGGGAPAAAIYDGPVTTNASRDTTLVTSQDWPTYGHDMQRTSIQPATSLTEANVAQLHQIWTYRSPAPYDLASPISVAGIVYAVDRSGNLVALDATTGAVRWQRALGANAKLTPSVFDGHLFVGTLDTSSPTVRSTLFALEPQTGAVQWQRSIDGGLHGPPVVVAGQLIVPVSLGDPGFCHPGGVYAFDETTGDPGLYWRTGGNVTQDGGAVWSPVSYDGKRIYFGTGNTCVDSPATANAVVGLSTSLALRWSVQTGSPMSDDDVGGGVVSNGNDVYVNSKNGSTYAIDASTGGVVWQRALGAPDLYGSYGTPAVVGSTLVTSIGFRYNPYGTYPTGTQFGSLQGLDRSTGAERWKVDAVAPFMNPPAISGSIAFIAIDANMTALDVQSGKILWSSAIESLSRSQAVVVNGEVLITDTDGDLYAYGLGSPIASSAARSTSHVRRGATMPYSTFLPKYCHLR